MPQAPPTPIPWTARPWLAPLIVALIAWVWVSFALDPAGDFPASFQGPGLTVDEIFNVDQGNKQVDRLLAVDITGYRKVITELPDHPPLGRIWLGLWHEFLPLVVPPPPGHSEWVIANARMASAAAFAFLVFITGWTAGRWYGNRVGLWTSLAVLLMPRLFGHAHLAALELPMAVMSTLLYLSIGTRWPGDKPPNDKTAALTGLLFGLTLLTKIQGAILPAPVGIWALAQWRWRAIRPMMIWGLSGVVLFMLGWTWMWEGSSQLFGGYLRHALIRAPILVTYFGQKIVDTNVPWHYPWVIFFSTIPVGWLFLGSCGISSLIRKGFKSDSRGWLILIGMLFPLFLFSLPRIAVYDGERLFLMSYPLWAIFVGRGADLAFDWLSRRTSRQLTWTAATLFCLAQGIGILHMAPCYLSYYNALVGGLAGASRLGLPVTYWGDGVTRELVLKSSTVVPAKGELALAPVLHPNHTIALLSQAPSLRAKEIQIIPYVEENGRQPRFLLMFPRLEYLPPGWGNGPPGYKPIQEVRRSGVLLGGLYERSPEPNSR
ncbi:MAG: glycosyltransferase family 39 protein [Planctomycetales bacterium]